MTHSGVREGNLVETDFADLVQELYEKRWTGVLTLTHRGHGRRISVESGQLVFASSSNPDDRLGELLLRQGRITLRQFRDASAGVRPGRRLGAILVDQEVLSPKDLVRAVVEHTKEIIYGAFQWTEGHYRCEQPAEASESITLRMSTPNVILEGIRRIESWSRIVRSVGHSETRYRRVDGAERMAHKMEQPSGKMALLANLDGIQDVGSICATSVLKDFEVCQTLWAFRVIGLVQRLDALSGTEAGMDDDGLGVVLAEG